MNNVIPTSMECTNIEESTNLIEIEGLQWQKGSLLLSIMMHTIFTLSQNILVVVLSLFFSPIEILLISFNHLDSLVYMEEAY